MITSEDGHNLRRANGRRILLTAAAIVALVVAGVILWPGNRDAEELRTGADPGTGYAPAADPAAADRGGQGPARAGGWLRLRRGLRGRVAVRGADDRVIAATLWTDFVESTGATGIDAYYQGVLTQTVPAWPITVLAEVTIGAGPPPVDP